jgi:hypothetical protein
MAENAQELVARIRALTREETMEAALALGAELDTGEQPQGEARRFLDEVEQGPLRHVHETEELARVLLVTAAADDQYAATVRRILDNLGSKALTLGGLEIVALAALAVTALHIVVSKGRTSHSKTTTFEYGPDGKLAKAVVAEGDRFGISPAVGKVLGAVAGGAPPP